MYDNKIYYSSTSYSRLDLYERSDVHFTSAYDASTVLYSMQGITDMTQSSMSGLDLTHCYTNLKFRDILSLITQYRVILCYFTSCSVMICIVSFFKYYLIMIEFSPLLLLSSAQIKSLIL